MFSSITWREPLGKGCESNEQRVKRNEPGKKNVTKTLMPGPQAFIIFSAFNLQKPSWPPRLTAFRLWYLVSAEGRWRARTSLGSQDRRVCALTHLCLASQVYYRVSAGIPGNVVGHRSLHSKDAGMSLETRRPSSRSLDWSQRQTFSSRPVPWH